MKQKKWIYVVCAALAVGLLLLLARNPEILARVPLMMLSVGIGLVLMLGVALMALWIKQRKHRREEAFCRTAIEISGIVARVERLPVKQRQGFYGMGDDLYLLRAIYDYQGKRYTGAKRSYFGRPAFQVGDPIPVYVDPRDPTRCMILAERDGTQNKTTV